MMRIILLSLLLSIPTAVASWGAYGEQEPNSAYDSPGLLWSDAPPVNANRVYFSAYQTDAETINPNSAMLETRLRAAPERSWNALLAVWTDCNEDGYVGIAESAMDQYPTPLLSAAEADTICPDGGANNAAGWVTEARVIGTDLWGGRGAFDDEPNSQRDPTMIVDNGAAIWGDAGLPGAPRGGEHATTNLLGSHDVTVERRSAASDPAAPWIACATTTPELPPAIFPRGMNDPGAALHVVSVCQPADDAIDTIYDTAAVNSGIDSWDAKVRADATFNFSAQKRGQIELGVGVGLGSPQTPPTFGISAFDYWNPLGAIPASGTSPGHGTTWHSDQGSASGPMLVGRDAPTPPGPDHWTFYASASRADGALPSSDVTYGFPACAIIGPGSPEQNGWNCDPSRWYQNAGGADQEPHHFGRLGDRYQMRDVDCWDGALYGGDPNFAPGYPSQFEAQDCAQENSG